jgi:uncharacterized membrane protein
MKWFFVVLVAVVILLHQDTWNWTDKTLVGGFMPIGLAYHGLYSCLAAVTMALLVKFLWPAHLEDEEEYTTPATAAAPAADEAR